jgi:hypothetical protein
MSKTRLFYSSEPLVGVAAQVATADITGGAGATVQQNVPSISSVTYDISPAVGAGGIASECALRAVADLPVCGRGCVP